MIRIYPYQRVSFSARRLARLLRGEVLPVDKTIHINQGDVIINWGSSKCPYINAPTFRLLNQASAVKLAANKLGAFNALRTADVPIPLFAHSIDGVSWKGVTVLRHKLTGHSGEGIEIAEKASDLAGMETAKLYVQYIKKVDEYRVHVIGKEIVIVQRKARRLEVPDGEVNWRVRNHRNGFVFARSDVSPPQSVLDAAVRAVAALRLDFGAVDIVWNADKALPYVLEVNTAPGLEGSSLNDYAEGFRNLLQTGIR